MPGADVGATVPGVAQLPRRAPATSAPAARQAPATPHPTHTPGGIVPNATPYAGTGPQSRPEGAAIAARRAQVCVLTRRQAGAGKFARALNAPTRADTAPMRQNAPPKGAENWIDLGNDFEAKNVCMNFL